MICLLLGNLEHIQIQAACYLLREYSNRRRRFDPWRRAWQPTTVLLPGESPWTEEPPRLQSMGIARSQTQLSDLAHILISGKILLSSKSI